MFALDFFANTECHPSGFGEGERFVGSGTVQTGPDGTVTFTLTIPQGTSFGQFVAGTATSPDGDSSAFSRCSVVGPPGAPGSPSTGSPELLPIDEAFLILPNTGRLSWDSFGRGINALGQPGFDPTSSLVSNSEEVKEQLRLDTWEKSLFLEHKIYRAGSQSQDDGWENPSELGLCSGSEPIVNWIL
jgi:hypothetical protein